MTHVVTFDDVGFGYDDDAPALVDIDVAVDTGDVLLVVGPSGSGKSTLLRAVNGLVPHTTGGHFRGTVTVAGRRTQDHRPRDLADTVGFVHQDPEAQFVVDEVEHDIAFALENLGMDPAAMRRRVEEVLDALGIAHLRQRSPTTLSGGERQRAAVAGALAAAPKVLVLDEPTSELDPQGADDVLAAVARLNADLGTTIMLAEHRLERAAPLADFAVRLDDGRLTGPQAVPELLAVYDGAPPVTHLGHLLGWSPPPLTVREALRAARGTTVPHTPGPDAQVAGDPLVRGVGLRVRLGGTAALRGVDLDVGEGEVVALLGRNGSGKTTLLRTLAGLLDPDTGTVDTDARIAYLPQDPDALLFAPTVRAELEHTLRLLGRRQPDEIDRWLERLGLTALADRHPRSLSAGQRQRVAIGAVAVGGADVLLLDEPTRGIDPPSAAALEHAVAEHAAGGGAVVLATHDVELAARCATRAVVLGDGEVVASGPARDVLAGSLFAPQVLRVLPPFLTVAEVAAALVP
jgi:energy-coupling factor transport system ATP-binding protein